MIASHLLLIGVFAAFTPPEGPKAPPEPQSLSRTGDGKPVCGLGKEFHADRRKSLCAALDGKGVVVLRGVPEQRDFLRFQQDKVFWYLTGVESPNASAIIDCASGRSILFLPPKNTFSESWNGELWDAGDDWVKELTGFDEVKKSADLVEVLEGLFKKQKKAWVSLHPHVQLAGCVESAHAQDQAFKKDALDGRESREQRLATRLQELFDAEVEDLSPALDELRRVKQPAEVAAMRRAGRSGALAMAEAIRSTRAGVGEWEIEAVMSFVQVKEGAAGPAYGAIVGSGKNSLVLHYMASSRVMQEGEVLLIDYAPELDHYACDITRTWPINGRFTERQAELYDAVLESQMAGIAAVRPGETIASISKVCNDVLKQRGFKKFIRHGPCHYIGMEVHDVGDYGKPFVPGVAFTIEPGLYEPETGIGIRIEDVVIVTEDGCEVVSDLVPKDREAIERLVREEGVLDWMSARQRAELASK